ncbi:hypothetical protein CR513_50606, partial [Mucuna pruriens]
METRTINISMATLIRRWKNTKDGIWEKLEKLVTNFYKNLFMEEVEHELFCLWEAFPSFVFDNREELTNMISLKEVKRTIFNMNSFKAFCLDDFQQIFSYPSKVDEINDTLIALILKIDRIRNMKNFMTISLYNVAYKIIIEILAQRLRHMILKLGSFIPIRQWLDNIIIVQEAYNRLYWSFVWETLEDIVSHLAIADDLLFTKAEVSQVKPIRTILKLFCKIFEQNVSFNKSQIYFSRNVP